MKFHKILLLMVLVVIGANVEVCAQESAKDSTKNPLATLFKGKRAEEKDNAAAQQQEAQDVTTHNEQEKSAEDKNKESRKKSHYDMLPDNEKKKVVDEALKEIKEKLDKNYYDLLEVDIQAEVRKKAQKEFVDTFEKVYRDSCEKYRDTLSWYKKDTVSRYIKDTIRLYNSFKDQKNTNEKLTKIRDKAIHDLETKIAEAKKLPISQLAPRLNACEAEYKPIGEGDTAFDKVKTLLDSLSNDLKLFNDVNSVLNSPYSVKSVNSALATIEVLKKNSVGCGKRLGELDKKATLLKEYESLVNVFNTGLIKYFGRALLKYRATSTKEVTDRMVKSTYKLEHVKNNISKISKIPYLKAQFEKYYEELNANPMDSSLEDRYIQKK